MSHVRLEVFPIVIDEHYRMHETDFGQQFGKTMQTLKQLPVNFGRHMMKWTTLTLSRQL